VPYIGKFGNAVTKVTEVTELTRGQGMAISFGAWYFSSPIDDKSVPATTGLRAAKIRRPPSHQVACYSLFIRSVVVGRISRGAWYISSHIADTSVTAATGLQAAKIRRPASLP
jgi:hypothetical protein